MLRQFICKLVGKRASRLLLVLGLLLTAFSLYKLVRTAMYVHECIVVTATVTDVVQKPFESTGDALENGILALGGTPSYSPLVRYTVPGGLVIDRMMTDADDTDYTVGQQVEVITPALDPSRAHINKWNFIWGWQCMQLGTGLVLTLLGFALKERQPKPQNQKQPRKAAGKKQKSGGTAPRKQTTRRKKQG